MEKSKILEVISSILLFFSKIALFFEDILGWPLSTIGYILTAWYNFLKKYTLLGVALVSLAFMCLYSWYKWQCNLSEEIQNFDCIIIFATFIFVIILYIKQTYKKDGTRNTLELMATIVLLSGFFFIGWNLFILGWTCLLVSHFLIGYLFFCKKAFLYVTLQAMSGLVAFYKITILSNLSTINSIQIILISFFVCILLYLNKKRTKNKKSV
ncbi:MAG: putative membrane protein [Flavobacteriaceae bacterium]|jgi:predicted membrane protein